MRILIAGVHKNTKNYETALTACGVSFVTSLDPRMAARCDRLLLPGGGDIHPGFFGQENRGSLSVDPQLDRTQFSILDAFVQTGKPVLGICRGLQVINVYFGGNIIQDLPTSGSHRYLKEDQFHTVTSVPGSLLHRLYGNSCTVNSAHHQGCGYIGHGLSITQIAPDGVIEALEHKTKPILGVQWHPERTGFAFRRDKIADGEKIITFFLAHL